MSFICGYPSNPQRHLGTVTLTTNSFFVDDPTPSLARLLSLGCLPVSPPSHLFLVDDVQKIIDTVVIQSGVTISMIKHFIRIHMMNFTFFA